MQAKRQVLVAIMDGVGERSSRFGNAVAFAHTPNLDYLKSLPLATTLRAHGTAVGLPQDSDIGNSEVGHNALGAGRVFDQGAKLVGQAIKNGQLFVGKTWLALVKRCREHDTTLHFIGLLSDGNVHSHEEHLYAMLKRAWQDGVKRLRVHVLFDGRDVGEKSAEVYVGRLEQLLSELRQEGCDAWAASGGGRMRITMDRYEADWAMVARGWQTHVEGQGEHFSSLTAALQSFRQQADLTDQYLPEFVLTREGKALGRMRDGDGVIFFNFRGDRAIEISQAFEQKEFTKFKRSYYPDVYYAGMMEYDGDTHVPRNFLVSPPAIDNTLGEYLAQLGVRQFACSETQKYGHVTYFWNGNRSGYFDQSVETYINIPSDCLPFDLKPWMKAYEITEETIAALLAGRFTFGRINYPNGDMVGHTGHFAAAVTAMNVVDLMIGRLIKACQQSKAILVVTADHGNCDDMFEAKEKDFPHWETFFHEPRPTPKTSHSLSPVPFYVYDPCGVPAGACLWQAGRGSLANVANTVLELMGLPPRALYEASLLNASR